MDKKEHIPLPHFLMHRDPNSRKGDNGSVTIIGGSIHLHGAPIFASLAAEASGVDLLYPCVPSHHAEITKCASYNFIVTPFRNDDLSKSDVSALEDVIAQSSVAVIGPGLAVYDTAQKAMKELIENAPKPMVLDASALQPWTFDALLGKTAVVTPHVGELGRMQGQILHTRSFAELKEIAVAIATSRKVIVLLKGTVDIIAGPDGQVQEVSGGNAGLTVGGTGDALAGLIGGLMAQGMPTFEASVAGATIIKRAAEKLEPTKGFSYTAMDVIGEMPALVKEMGN